MFHGEPSGEKMSPKKTDMSCLYFIRLERLFWKLLKHPKKYHKTTFKEKELDPKKTFANFRSVAKDLTLNLARNKASEFFFFFFFFFFHSQWSVHWSTGCKDPATQKTRLSGHYRATLLREDEVQTCSWQKKSNATNPFRISEQKRSKTARIWWTKSYKMPESTQMFIHSESYLSEEFNRILELMEICEVFGYICYVFRL